MSATNHTTTIELSQYISTDKPTYLTDYNGDMLKIDNAIAADREAITAAQSKANTADGKADANKTSIDTLGEQINGDPLDPSDTGLAGAVSGNTGSINTINSLIGNGEPTTTDKTIIGAINELNANEGALSNLTTTEKSSLVGAVNELNSGKLDASEITGNLLLAGFEKFEVTADGVKTYATLLGELKTAIDAYLADMDESVMLRISYAFVAAFGSFAPNVLTWYEKGHTIGIDLFRTTVEAAQITIRQMSINTTCSHFVSIMTSTPAVTITDASANVPTNGTKLIVRFDKYITM